MYEVFDVKKYEQMEQLGTKQKFWYYDNEDNVKKLFKAGRPMTGENWAEKATSELASLFGLPAAIYDLAYWEEMQGVITPSFVPKNGRLIHGNELLAKIITDYQKEKRYQLREYKLVIVLKLLDLLNKTVSVPIGYKKNSFISMPMDTFIGYLVFDCWVANLDRHHENWGLVLDAEHNKVHLAPTYDHASGLGCRVSDEERKNRLATKDHQYTVSAFVQRGKSAFYSNKHKSLRVIDTIKIAMDLNPTATTYWIERLAEICHNDIDNIFRNIDEKFITNPAIDFAIEILSVNKKRIKEIKCVLA